MQRRQYFSRDDVEDMIRRDLGLPNDAEIEWHSDLGGVAIWQDSAQTVVPSDE